MNNILRNYMIGDRAMKNIYKDIMQNNILSEFDFPVYYRERGKLINNNIAKLPPICPEKIDRLFSNIEINFDKLKKDIFDILDIDKGYIILWYLNSVKVKNNSILDQVSPFFKKINEIKRGGINTYKQNGWMVHVLYVYQLISFNIPNDLMPTSFNVDDYELRNTFHVMNRLYWNMKEESRLVLRVLALIHDIGIVDGVQNHDRDGEKYVVNVLNDLSIDEAALQKYEVNYTTFVELLEIFVANHTLINKISAEESDLCIYEKCDLILKRLKKCNDFTDDQYRDIAPIFLLIGMMDLIAVDDSLFTVTKFELAYNSYAFLNNIFMKKKYIRKKEDVALMRLQLMLPDNLYTALYEESIFLMKRLNIPVDEFWSGLFDVYEFEYATAFLKLLNNLEYVLIVLYKMINLFNKVKNRDEKCIVKFDSEMPIKQFVLAFKNGEYNKAIDLCKDYGTYKGNMISMRLIYTKIEILLEISS